MFAGKDDPWQQQQQVPTYRSQVAGSMGHIIAGQQMMVPPQPLQQPQRMMYPYPSMAQGTPPPPQQQMMQMGMSLNVASPYGGQPQPTSPLSGMIQQPQLPAQGQPQQRYMYSQQQQQQQPLSAVGGASGYYSSGSTLSPSEGGAEESEKRGAPMYAQQQQPPQQQDLHMPPQQTAGDDGEFSVSPASAGLSGPSGSLPYEKGGLDVLPPPLSQHQQQQQQQYPIDSESSHVRPPEGEQLIAFLDFTSIALSYQGTVPWLQVPLVRTCSSTTFRGTSPTRTSPRSLLPSATLSPPRSLSTRRPPTRRGSVRAASSSFPFNCVL